MIVHPGHLKDDQLLDCYLARRSGESLDPRAADHMVDCKDCETRYDDLVGFLDDLRDEADAETDALFPAEYLRDQQDQILRRLEHLHRPARVISFPAKDATSGSRTSVRVTPRWLAAAAAAGLFIGVAVGGFLAPDRFRHATLVAKQTKPAPAAMLAPRPATPAVRTSTTQADTPDDDAFVMELELALARPHTRELQPFDAMTPHVRDIDSRGR